MTDEVEARARTVLADVCGLDAAAIDASTSTDTVEEWDSLRHLTLVLALEEEFGIQFDDEDTAALVTFPLIVTIVAERLGAA